jgi:hypothetical protein
MVNLYKITEKIQTMGFSNPTFVLADSREEAVSKIEARLHVFFPTYKVTIQAIELIADPSEIIL